MNRRSFALFVVVVMVSPVIMGIAYVNPLLGGAIFLVFLLAVLMYAMAVVL